MISGKQLDERVGYARVLFKDNVFCLQNQNSVHCKPKQIIFYFGHGSLKYPAILVSKNLFKPALVDSEWKEVTEHKEKNITVLGLPISDYYVQTPIVQKEAYTELISHILTGRRNSFVSTENLLASWDFWTPLLTSITNAFPRVYPGGVENKDMLDVLIKGRDLSYINEVVLINQDQMGRPNNFQVMQGKFRSDEMVSGWTEELIEKLASDIEEAAEKAVLESGVFHLAVSGGASPLALFHRLALHHFAFPWRDTHVWMVDERCVPLSESDSNFHNLHDHLLQHVKIPYYNIHPMPVQLNQRLCVEEDKGTWLYEEEIRKFVNASSFHFVLLGVGYDGHIASLFPGVKPEHHGQSLVVFTESPVKPHQRMSLTFNSINKAQKVAILIIGKYKHEAVIQLSRVKGETTQWPVTFVKPDSSNLVWYLDYEALLG